MRRREDDRDDLEQVIQDYWVRLRENTSWRRERLGIPVTRMCVIAGIGPKTWYNIIDGTYTPEFRTVVGLGVALNAEPGDFFLAPAEFKTAYKSNDAGAGFVVSIQRPAPKTRPARKPAGRQNRRAKRTLSTPLSDLHYRRPA